MWLGENARHGARIAKTCCELTRFRRCSRSSPSQTITSTVRLPSNYSAPNRNHSKAQKSPLLLSHRRKAQKPPPLLLEVAAAHTHTAAVIAVARAAGSDGHR